MLLSLMLFLFLGAQDSMSPAPPVTVHDLKDKGVQLIGVASPDFRSLLSTAVGYKPVPELEPALPFSTVLRNNTDRRIIAYTVRWACTARSGAVQYNDRTTWNLFSMRGGDAIDPHTNRFVSLVFNFQIRSISTDSVAQNLLSNEVETLRECREVAILLDAVVFSDGLLIGPDATQTEARVRAWFDSEKDLLTDLASKQGTAEAEVTDWLREAANAKSRAPIGPPFARYYLQYRAGFARSWLAAGVTESTPDKARTRLLNRNVPTVHRDDRDPQ